MKIECLCTFLDDRDRFEAGEVRTVDDDRGARFIAAGWAKEAGADPLPAATSAAPDTTLDVQDGTLSTEDNHG